MKQTLWVIFAAKPRFLPRFIWRWFCSFMEVRINTTYNISIPWPSSKKMAEEAEELLKKLPKNLEL